MIVWSSSIVDFAEYIRHTADTDTYIRFELDQIALAAGGTTIVQIVEGATDFVNFPAGLVFVNDTSNTNMTQGITINQGANDDEILALQSSDVDHTLVGVCETDTYGLFQKSEADAGGVRIRGLKDANAAVAGASILLQGYLGVNADTDKTTAARAVVETYAAQISGGALANIVADGNVFGVRCRRGGANVTVAFVDEDGDFYYDGALNNYDEFDDALVIEDLRRGLTGAWNDTIGHNQKQLEALGVIAVGDDGSAMVSNKRLTALLMGAIGQLYQRVNELEARI